jgi:hypothetical protein
VEKFIVSEPGNGGDGEARRGRQPRAAVEGGDHITDGFPKVIIHIIQCWFFIYREVSRKRHGK